MLGNTFRLSFTNVAQLIGYAVAIERIIEDIFVHKSTKSKGSVGLLEKIMMNFPRQYSSAQKLFKFIFFKVISS